MSKYTEIFNYMRECPLLADLWSIAATEDIGVNVILPQGSSPAVQYSDKMDIYGNFECDMVPYPSAYEDYQINCYRVYDAKDSNAPESNINVMTIDEVQSICDWISEQNEKGDLPQITGKKVFAVECNPRVPQIRYINEKDNIIAYFITVRIHFVNNMSRRSVCYEVED